MTDAPNDATLGVAIDRDAELPIGLQLAWSLRAQIGDGRLQPGQRLPALRNLADSLGVNVNTVRAVYQRLEHEGVIESRHGSGTFVTAEPLSAVAATAIAANAIQEAREASVDPRVIAAAIYVTTEATTTAPEPDAERRRLLRAQIAALEQVICETCTTARPAVPPREGPELGPRLLSAAELERVRDDLVVQLAMSEPRAGHSAPSATQSEAAPQEAGERRVNEQPAAKRRPIRIAPAPS